MAALIQLLRFPIDLLASIFNIPAAISREIATRLIESTAPVQSSARKFYPWRNMAKLFPFIVYPEAIQDRSDVYALKNRLDWGEPALTIVDVRDRDAFNVSRIRGAIAMPIDELVTRARASLEPIRDIYVYGETEEQTVEAAAKLRDVGYQHVAELVGGLTAWKAAKYPFEGV
jgi:rhodanese-related sulfurtransferase